MRKTSEGLAKTPVRSTRRAGVAVLTLAVAALGLGACEGDNLFTGDGPTLQPRVLQIGLPQQVRAGETISVRVDAVAPRYVNEVIVSVRGAIAMDTVIEIEDDKQQISTVVPVMLPTILQDTVLLVEAQISDMAGVRSPARQAVSSAFGPPTVESVGVLGGVRPGESATINVVAFGSRRISQLRVSARGAFTKDTTVAVTPPASTVNRTIGLPIPLAVDDTLATISVTALDESGVVSDPKTTQLPFIVDAPTVAILTPPSVAPGANLNIQVEAQSLRQISKLNITVRGTDFSENRVFTVDPQRTQVSEFVAIAIPGNTLSSSAEVTAFAIDRAGAASSPVVQTVSIPSGGPMILSVDGPATALGGHLVDIRVNATGTRPIKEVVVRWRGFIADSLTTPQTVAVINPARSDVSQDFTVRVPCYTVDQTLLVLVTARDQADQQSAVASTVVGITGNPECVSPDDTMAGPRMPAKRLQGIVGSEAPLSFDAPVTDAVRPEPFVLFASRRTSRRGRKARR